MAPLSNNMARTSRQLDIGFAKPLEEAFSNIRLEQLKQGQIIQRNTQRIEELEKSIDRVSEIFQTAPLRDTKLSKTSSLKQLPKDDDVTRKISESIRSLVFNMSKFLNPKAEGKEDSLPFADYIRAMDTALLNIESYRNFSDYYANDTELNEDQVPKDAKEEKEVLAQIVANAISADPHLDLSSKQIERFMQKLGIVLADELIEAKDFRIDRESEEFKDITTAIINYMEGVKADKDLILETCSNINDLDRKLPTMIYATLLYAKTKSDKLEDLIPLLQKSCAKLYGYHDTLTKRIMPSHPERKEEITSKCKNLSDIYELPYKKEGVRSVLLNHVDQFNNEAYQAGGIKNLADYLGQNSHALTELKSQATALIKEALSSLSKKNIHGEFISTDKDSKETQTNESFEKILANVLMRTYSLMTFKALPYARAMQLVEWAFSEENREEKDLLREKTSYFIADPEGENLQKFFLANKQKIVLLSIFDNLVINRQGQITSLDNNPTLKLTQAVKKIQN